MNRIKELEELILKHKALYYAGTPEILDHQYDALEEELKSLAPDSYVLQIVGSDPGANKVKHDKKMLSLNKVYSLEELLKWQDGHELISLFKIDGMSCSLIYENGHLVLAKTRGDGTFGENITAKVLWIDSVPKFISGFSAEVRGEIYCTEENFIALAEQMQRQQLEVPSSQRNIVAGLIGRKDHIELAKFLTFTPFELLEEQNFKTELDKLQRLEKLGFNTIEAVVCRDKHDIEQELERCRDFMQSGDFLIDGQVFIINNLSLHEKLGYTAHHPKFKMAFKFKGESAVATIQKISWSVSRNGILTPVANILPVELSGAKISRVTLHNYGIVKQFNLKRGDQIEIIRSGEVIPKFLSVVKAAEGNFTIPDSCPSCAGDLIVQNIRLICSNENCPARKLEEILNFIQKIGIQELSSKRLEQMMRAGLVKEIADIYKLKKEDLIGLEKTKDKLADKLLAEINRSKQVDLITFLSALGIPGGAYNRCEKVVKAGFDTLEKIKSLTVEALCQVDGFAEKSAEDFVSGIKKRNYLIDQLLDAGLSIKKIELKDQFCFCITGALSEKRSLIEARIREHGHKVVSSVTKETTHLVCNKPSSSSKYKKAEALGIPIITEEQLKKILG